MVSWAASASTAGGAQREAGAHRRRRAAGLLLAGLARRWTPLSSTATDAERRMSASLFASTRRPGASDTATSSRPARGPARHRCPTTSTSSAARSTPACIRRSGAPPARQGDPREPATARRAGRCRRHRLDRRLRHAARHCLATSDELRHQHGHHRRGHRIEPHRHRARGARDAPGRPRRWTGHAIAIAGVVLGVTVILGWPWFILVLGRHPAPDHAWRGTCVSTNGVSRAGRSPSIVGRVRGRAGRRLRDRPVASSSSALSAFQGW